MFVGLKVMFLVPVAENNKYFNHYKCVKFTSKLVDQMVSCKEKINCTKKMGCIFVHS